MKVLESAAQMESSAETITVEPATASVKLASPRFLAFLLAQFLGVVNDNAFRVTLILFVLSMVTGEARQVRYSSLATALIPLPYILFSPLAGYLADRFPKHRVLLWTKAPEIISMLLAAVGFYLRSLPFLYFVLFLVASRAAFFSPAKFGILPEILSDAGISAGNGILELVSDIAILAGSLLGVYAYTLFASNLANAGLVYVAIAGLGTVAILFVPRTPSGHPGAEFAWNVLRSFGRDYAEVRGNPTLFYTLVGIAWFGFIASFFLTVIPVFGKNELNLDQTGVGLLFALLAIGIGMGAVAAGRLSRGHVEIGLVPIGSAGITIFSFLLARAGTGRVVPLFELPRDAALDIVMIGFSSGFFVIPLNALLQQRSPAGMKGRLIAFANVLMFGAILIAAGVPWILTSVFRLSIREVIFFAAIVTLVGTVYVLRRLPDFLTRFLVWVLTNTLYRLRTVGAENQPKGGALLVANHVSMADGFLVSGSTSRFIRFLAYREYYEMKAINWYFRLTHTIPVAANDPPERTRRRSSARAKRSVMATWCAFSPRGR